LRYPRLCQFSEQPDHPMHSSLTPTWTDIPASPPRHQPLVIPPKPATWNLTSQQIHDQYPPGPERDQILREHHAYMQALLLLQLLGE
jgi:hypothetical protein